jgi:hypothetical protein
MPAENNIITKGKMLFLGKTQTGQHTKTAALAAEHNNAMIPA